VIGSLVLLLADGMLQLVGPALTQRVIDVAIPRGDARLVLTSAALFATTLLFQFAFTYGETMLTSLLGQRVMRDLRVEIFAHLQHLSVSFFDRNPVGRLVTRVTSDVESLNEMFTAGVVAGIGDLFTLLAISIAMLVVDWRLALAAFAVIPGVVIASNVFRVRVRESYRAIRTRLARINAFLQERISGVRVVQLFGREGSESQRFDALNRDHLEAHLRSVTVYALYFPVVEIQNTFYEPPRDTLLRKWRAVTFVPALLEAEHVDIEANGTPNVGDEEHRACVPTMMVRHQMQPFRPTGTGRARNATPTRTSHQLAWTKPTT
jgi:ATP-binding cassette subfamily B protein